MKNIFIILAASLLFFSTEMHALDNKDFDISKIYFNPQNKTHYKIYYKDKYITDINIYNYHGKYIIPISRIAQILDGNVKIDYDNKIINVKLPEFNSVFSVNITEKKISQGNSTNDLPIDSAFLYENEAFFSVELIQNYMPISVKVMNSEAKILIYIKDEVIKAQKDKITGLLKEKHIENVKQDLLKGTVDNTQPVEKKEPIEGILEAPQIPPGDNSLILATTINKIEMEDFIEANGNNNIVYLPLSEISKLLEFGINVDSKNRVASGWFLKESNFFEINEKEAKSVYQTIALNKNDLIFTDSDILINSEILAKLLNIHFETDLPQMVLNITSEQPFPFEEKLRREREQIRALAQRQKKEIQYKKIETPYNSATTPITDVSINYGYSSELAESNTSSYSLVSSNDIGYMTSNVFASGDFTNEALSEFRIKLGRTDNDKELLGKLHASEYQFGDIDAYSIPLVNIAGQGRGFKMSNRNITRPDQFDSTNLIGDATPGWDAEIYRNDTLLDFQTVGSDGKYQFLNVPILYGRNIFKIVLYGPQGQVRETYKEFNVNTAIIDQGEFTYNVSADEKSETLFGISNITKNHPGGIRTSTEFEYGVYKWLTAAGGYAHTLLEDGEHDYITNSLRASLGKAIGSLDNACDVTQSGCASRASLFSSVWDTDIRLQQGFFNNYISEEADNILDPKVSETNLDLNREFLLPYIDQISAGLNLSLIRQESGIERDVIANRLSKNIYGVNFTNLIEKDIGTTPTTDGVLSARGYIDNFLIAANANYNLEPKAEVLQLDLLGQHYINPKITNRVDLSKDLADTGKLQLGDTLTFDMKKYTFSITSSIDDSGEYFLGIGLNFSFAKIPGTDKWYFQNRPMADSGTLIGTAFYDKNYNYIKDPEEKYLKSPSLRVNIGSIPKTDQDYIVTSNIIPYQPTKVSYNLDDLKDPTLVPAVEGYEYKPRPGYIQKIEIPILEASEIEGSIFIRTKDFSSSNTKIVSAQKNIPAEKEGDDETNEYSLEEALKDGVLDDVNSRNVESIDILSGEDSHDDNEVPGKYLTLELLDEKGNKINETKSEFDGYFNFTKVLPGKYKIISKDPYGNIISTSEEIIIDKPDFYSVDDIYVEK